MEQTIKVVVADDQKDLASELKSVLETDSAIEVVAIA